MSNRERGQGLVEYALILVLVAIVVIALIALGPIGWAIAIGGAVLYVVYQFVVSEMAKSTDYEDSVPEKAANRAFQKARKSLKGPEIRAIKTTNWLEEIVHTDKITMDNLGGNVPQEMTDTFSHTEICYVSTGVSGQLGLNKVFIAGLEKAYQVKNGHQISKTQTFTLKAAPQTCIRHEIVWKKKSAEGYLVALVDGEEKKIPFKLDKSLDVEVKSEEVK